jgi:hypothetical protein
MSYSAIGWAENINLGPRSGTRRVLLLVLADMMNRTTGRLNPKVSTLVRKTGRSERCVQYALRWLEAAGLLTQLAQAGRHSCHYVLHVGSVPRFQVAPQAGANLHPKPASFAPQAGANLHPEPREDFNQEGEPRESAPAAPPPPAPPSPQVDEILVDEGKQGCRQVGPVSAVVPTRVVKGSRKTHWPEDPPPEVRQMVMEAGYDPDEMIEEMADWCRDRDHQSADWPAFARRWIRREGTFRRPVQDHGGRASEILAGLRASFASGAIQ